MFFQLKCDYDPESSPRETNIACEKYYVVQAKINSCLSMILNVDFCSLVMLALWRPHTSDFDQEHANGPQTDCV